MANSQFEVTKEKQVALALAYLAYSGEEIVDGEGVPAKILALIDATIPEIDVLDKDWQVVWGPAIYTFEDAKFQDNMMYVAQKKSDPSQYVVAVRGTNGVALLDWAEEDLRVLHKVDWQVPAGVSAEGNPQISKATEIGLNALLNILVPDNEVKAAGQSITTFLTGLAKDKVDICFTGHSLAGALSPTLALWFRQAQGIAGGWDPSSNATIATIPFAGPTAGNTDFANYFNQQLGTRCDRIHNTNDIVPNAWETDNLRTLQDLYLSAGIEMTDAECVVVDLAIEFVRDYAQVETSDEFTFPVSSKYDSYLAEAGYQHVDSYPDVLKMPDLSSKIKKKWPDSA